MIVHVNHIQPKKIEPLHVHALHVGMVVRASELKQKWVQDLKKKEGQSLVFAKPRVPPSTPNLRVWSS